MTFEFNHTDKQAIIAALSAHGMVDDSVMQRAMYDTANLVSLYQCEKANQKSRSSERKSILQRLRSKRPMEEIMHKLRPGERAWLYRAEASIARSTESIKAELKKSLENIESSKGEPNDPAMRRLLIGLLDIWYEATNLTPTCWDDSRRASDSDPRENGNAHLFLRLVAEPANIQLPFTIEGAICDWLAIRKISGLPAKTPKSEKYPK